MTVRAVVAATVACLAAAASGSARVQAQVAPPTAFDIYWNGPSSGCHNPPIPLENYTSIRVNEGQAFVGEEIACFYSIGVFPRLTATQNATPCWSKHTSGCSWNPWDNITAVANNGVPQLANLTLHKEKVVADVEQLVPDPQFSGLLVVDWEAWRPLTAENDDGLSLYTEYSRRMVLADPTWPGDKTNSTAVRAEATARFDAGAKDVFLATVDAVKQVRPHARVGFYSQGINHGVGPGGDATRAALLWLWSAVDALFPSIYPRSTNVSVEAASVESSVRGAMLAADLGENASAAAGAHPPRRPAVFPYARALVAPGDQPFTPGLLATQVQLAAGLGADGVVLWGASSDYHGSGCAMVAGELSDFAGDTMDECVHNRIACSAAKCSGHGRCIDYSEAALLQTCLESSSAKRVTVTCRCDPGYSGPSCAESRSK